jgi:S1-C subfamily serine protease
MVIARGTGVAFALLMSAGSAAGQHSDVTTDLDARARELSQRLRISLEQQARAMTAMQRDLERASRAEPRTRDSIVRDASRRISQLATEIAKVQVEADRAQFRELQGDVREQLFAQIVTAREMANVSRLLADRQRTLSYRMSSPASSRPRGYIGVTLSGMQGIDVRDGRVFTVFLSPSIIESVEAGAPAALSGLVAGDTIVAFGRHAVPGAVPLSDVMTPGDRVRVKYRRDGTERSAVVTVAERTNVSGGGSSFSFSVTGPDVVVCNTGACSSAPLAASGPSVSRTPRVPGLASAPPAPASSLVRERYPAAVTFWSSNDYAIAGAMLANVTEDLEELTGRREGILVLRVAPGTPAATSGLRGGDVIVRISDDACTGVRDLQLAVQRASTRGQRTVELTLVRQRRERTISLQW